MNAIEVQGLVKQYGKVKAVDGVTFAVEQGMIFGMLGPNGAGKTTTVECAIGLKAQNAGTVSILGMNPSKERKRLYERIGVQLQEASYQDKIKVWELCGLFASLYQEPADANQLLERMGLLEKKNAYVHTLSGGQKQKLSILLALLPNPEIVFLDELTTGLDPNARRAMWDHVRELKREGRTVFMTTHFMEEAEQLCDRVCVIDHGRIIAMGTVDEVITSCGLRMTILFDSPMEGVASLFGGMEQVLEVTRMGNRYSLSCSGENAPGKVACVLEQQGIDYYGFTVNRPSLEDAYMKLTGRSMGENGHE